MSRSEFAALLEHLHQAARAGRDLSAAPAATAARLLRLDAVTVSLLPARGAPELLWTDPADRFGHTLEDLQYAVGEGPTWQAARTGHAVTVPDLTAAAATRRWPAFAPAAARTRARAVIAVPLCRDGVSVGALTGYRTIPAPFPDGQQRDCTLFARAAVDLLLQTPPESWGTDADGVDLYRAEVHQAAGMLSVHLRVGVEQALLRLRAYAWRSDRSLGDVAHDVVTGRLRLD